MVGPQGGTESDRSAGGSQSATDLMYVAFESRESPVRPAKLLALFLRLNLRFYSTASTILGSQKGVRSE